MSTHYLARLGAILVVAGTVGCNNRPASGSGPDAAAISEIDAAAISEIDAAAGSGLDASADKEDDGGASPVTLDASTSCEPTTCTKAGYSCGLNGDGCGGTIDCGSCQAPAYCGGGGYSKCGGGTGLDGGQCVPFTCDTAPNGPFNCGMTGDGCGGSITCGECPLSQFCGGGGFNRCGGSTGLEADGGVPCTPATLCPAGQNCGLAADGCGGVIPCGSCAYPEFCGGGGPSVCGGNGLTPDGSVPCTPTTSCPAGQNCGFAADGCGGVIGCGTCTNPQFCGGGGPGICGGNDRLNPDGSVACVPTTCAALGDPCGLQGDGCGGVLACAQCTPPQTCGGGGHPSECGGNNDMAPDGGVLCARSSCASYPAGTCGQQADGCGGLTANCGTCAPPDSCGGGGAPSACGNSLVLPDGGYPCSPLAVCPVGVNCGVAADGCGGLNDCGSCMIPEACGGGGSPGQCGNSGLNPDGTNPCTPTSCAKLGFNCGATGDGCGGLLDCGWCTNPQFCGGGGPNKCGGDDGLLPDGGVACTPTTCAKLGYNCGEAADGCGGLLSCGACTIPQWCGGAGFDVCGPPSLPPCGGGKSTTLTGYVYDPANKLPVYNALVYVPVGAVQTPTTGVDPASPTCGCTAPAAYASAYTNISGAFALNNVPSGSTTVVVQLGKWQRVFTQAITACLANTVSNGASGSHLTLPSTHLQGNIPLIAVDTGATDAMECVLSKMGIATTEFVNPAIVGGQPTAAGRVHLYQGINYNGGAIIDANTPTEDALTETASVMNSYDTILFACQGGAGSYIAANGWPNTLGNLLGYTGAGGRMFATHFHYDLLDGNGSFSGTANWALESGQWGNYYGDPTYPASIDQTFPAGSALAQWLHQPAVYGGTLGVIPVGVVREDFTSVNAPAQRWLYAQGPTPPAGIPLHYTFDTPFGQSPSCGRVVYSDFHVESQPTSSIDFTGLTFPTECPSGATGPMTPQEMLLEFMLFNLTSCVSAPTCAPKTCADFAGKCGVQGDGCGGVTANCGACTAPNTCGGGGTPSVCGYPSGGTCAPKTCASYPSGTCGSQSDGCGGVTAACSPCTAPATCGGGGMPSQCGFPVASCTPLTCASFPPTTCGEQSDGCGGHTVDCNPCTPPATCGGDGVPNQCGYPTAGCTPSDCGMLKLQCGSAADGCGGTLDCGGCPSGSACIDNLCVPVGGTDCTSRTCAQLDIECGLADDGCGNLLTCPDCPGDKACLFNVCVPIGAVCTQLTCADYPSSVCGPQSDACGGHTDDCNPCTSPAVCGGGGVPSQCGLPAGGTCIPLGCADYPAGTCGPQSDGCGGITAPCNPCTAPAICGGGGVPDQCGYPVGGHCTGQTCQQQNIGCGPAGDGCGNLLSCGDCTAPETCGGGGVRSQCGAADAGACLPANCGAQNIECGPAGDGCGKLLQCGTCTGGKTCGGAGSPGKCG